MALKRWALLSNALDSSSEFTPEERKAIEPFFTNLDKDVFALTNLPEVVKGALFSRYSRSDKSLRRVLLDEFILKPEMGFKEIVGFQVQSGTEQTVAVQKAEEFYDRVLVGYGDDSVAELGGAHLACENVSNIASKVLEEPRIGLSPLEKSTRYVWFDKKNAKGEYKYYREPEIMASNFADSYVETCDFLFDTYAKLVEPVKKFVVERFPQEENVSERAYASAVKAKACDIIRGLLPASTLTNVGIFGNGRAFEYLLLKMNASDLQEMRLTAGEMQAELSKVIPSFVKRADDRHGQATQQYLKETLRAVEKTSGEVLSEETEPAKEVTLVDFDENALDNVVSAILYPSSHAPLEQIKRKIA
ncbi:MAG: FAD-dependent thymidylate synthase, partial [Candidatus Micrarchaeota archaeon]